MWIIFLILAQKTDCGYSLVSNKNPQAIRNKMYTVFNIKWGSRDLTYMGMLTEHACFIQPLKIEITNKILIKNKNKQSTQMICIVMAYMCIIKIIIVRFKLKPGLRFKESSFALKLLVVENF